MMRVLVLRPEPGASATAARARSLGLDAVELPLFEIEAVEWAAPDPQAFDALLLTSANAVRFGCGGLRALAGLPAHAVGEATAEAAREAGFTIATTGDSDVDALLGSLDAGLRLLHLCGEDRTLPTRPRQQITPVIVYRSKEKASVDLAQARGSVALVHSSRAGARFAELIDGAGVERSSIAIAAISPAAAGAAGNGWNVVEAAATPNDDTLLALAARLCNNLPRR